jgi:hypothetical protein
LSTRPLSQAAGRRSIGGWKEAAMEIGVRNVDLEHIESVDEIEPKPTLALREGDHYIGPLGSVGKRLMLELMKATDESEPTGDRVFGRLGLDYQSARWNDWEIYWARRDEQAVVEALKRWNSAHSM